MTLAKCVAVLNGIYTVLTPAAHMITIFCFCMEMFHEDGNEGP